MFVSVWLCTNFPMTFIAQFYIAAQLSACAGLTVTANVSVVLELQEMHVQ